MGKTAKATSAALISAVVLLAWVSLAAAETSRTEYVATVEPICKANTEANERILKPVKAQVKAGKLSQAAQRFSKAAAALKTTHAQLAAVPQPAADAAKLGTWLGYVKTEGDLFAAVAAKLKAGQKGAAQAKVNKLSSNANQANATVLSFNFRYCRFEPSKFT
jgi:hypothetical protein